MQQDKQSELLVFHEMEVEFLKNKLLPIPNFATFFQLQAMKAPNDMTGFWSTFNNHSRCASTCGVAFLNLDCPSGSRSLPISIAVDLAGIHFFYVNGSAVVMSWYWSTIFSLKVQTRPAMILLTH